MAWLSAAPLLIGLPGLTLVTLAPRVVGCSSDPVLIARAAPLVLILAVTTTFDGGQVLLGQALGNPWLNRNGRT